MALNIHAKWSERLCVLVQMPLIVYRQITTLCQLKHRCSLCSVAGQINQLAISVTIYIIHGSHGYNAHKIFGKATKPGRYKFHLLCTVQVCILVCRISLRIILSSISYSQIFKRDSYRKLVVCLSVSNTSIRTLSLKLISVMIK